MNANTKLKNARLLRNIEQERLAQIVGVSTATYGRWERGQGEPPLTYLRTLCAFFNMPPEELGYVIYKPATTQSTICLDQSREQVL